MNFSHPTLVEATTPSKTKAKRGAKRDEYTFQKMFLIEITQKVGLTQDIPILVMTFWVLVGLLSRDGANLRIPLPV